MTVGSGLTFYTSLHTPLLIAAPMLDANALKNTAIKNAGLDDFGDTSFNEGFDILITSLNHEAKLNSTGIRFFTANIIDTLVSRLKILEAKKHNPSPSSKEVSGPIFIVGTGRTGSTLLHATLNASSQNRSLDESLEYAKLFKQLDNSPISCTDVFAHTFKSIIYFHLAYIPTYFNWFINSNYNDLYTFHKDVVHLVPVQKAKTWVFKSTQHAFSMPALAECYPSSRIVHMHRDPVRAYYSRSTTSFENFRRYSDDPNKSDLDKLMVEMTKTSILRMIEFRNNFPYPVFDLVYEKFLLFPIESIVNLYSFFDLDLNEVSLKQIETYISVKHDMKKSTERDLQGLDTPRDLKELFEYLIETYSISASI